LDSAAAGTAGATDHLEEARASLGALIVEEFGPAGDPRPAATHPETASWRRRDAFRRSWRAWALAPAACAALVAAYLVLGPESPPSDEIILRGSGESLFRIEEPLVRDDGSVLLRWRSVAGAGSYRVQILGKDLSLVAELPAGSDTMRMLSRSETAGGAPAPGLLWRVVAYAGSRTVAESEVSALPDR
jgi:hypothetical protein